MNTASMAKGGRLRPFVEGMTFTECPRWHEGRLWFSDFYSHAVYAATPDGTIGKIVDVPNRPGGLGWLPDGRLLVVSSLDRKVLRLEQDGTLVEHADISAFSGGPANDLITTADGIAYVGNMGFDVLGGGSFAPASLARVMPDGMTAIETEPMHFPNGCAVTADGRTLIVAETMGNRLSAFEILPGGALGPRSDWARFGDVPTSTDLMEIIAHAVVGADGIAIDGEDCVWVADAYHHRAVRVEKGGRILDEIALGEEQVYGVALGGVGLRTLFLCVAPSFNEEERSSTRQGRILAWSLDG